MQPLCKTVWRFLKKLKIEPPYDPAVPLLGTYAKEMKSLFQELFIPSCSLHIIHSGQGMETNSASNNRRMDKVMRPIYINDGILAF